MPGAKPPREPLLLTERRRPARLSQLRASFFTGVVVTLPFALTVWLIWTVTGWIDQIVLPFVPWRFRPEHYIGINLRGVGVIFLLAFIVLVGWVARGVIGRAVIRQGENLVDRMPIIRSVYGGAKQIAETVFSQDNRNFEHACLVEYPRRGVWALAFVSTHAKGEVAERQISNDPLLSVFLPSTPNPTTGFLLFVPESEVVILEMSVEDAAKLVISAGLVYPASQGGGAPPQAKPLPAAVPPRGRVSA